MWTPRRQVRSVAGELTIVGVRIDEDEFPRPSAADAIGRMGTPPPAAEVAENSRPLDTAHAVGGIVPPPAKAAKKAQTAGELNEKLRAERDKPADTIREDWPEVVVPFKPEGGLK